MVIATNARFRKATVLHACCDPVMTFLRFEAFSKKASNQLRQDAATELRKIHGLEGTRTVLGHSSTDMTQVYAEIDFDAARKIMLASG